MTAKCAFLCESCDERNARRGDTLCGPCRREIDRDWGHLEPNPEPIGPIVVRVLRTITRRSGKAAA